MKLAHVDASGFHFSNNGRFCKSLINTHLLANTLVQIKPCNNYFGIFLMETNNVVTNNSAWKEFNKYRYLANELRTVFGSYDQRPSSIDNYRPLKVFMLTNKVAEQLLTTNLLYLSEREYKDIRSLIKTEYLVNFKYELPSKTIELPTETVAKQSKNVIKSTENNVVKVGSQLIQRPVRKAG